MLVIIAEPIHLEIAHRYTKEFYNLAMLSVADCLCHISQVELCQGMVTITYLIKMTMIYLLLPAMGIVFRLHFHNQRQHAPLDCP